jgi:hypothetical protein
MAKTKSNRNRGGAKQRGNWSNTEHDARTAKRMLSMNKKRMRHQQQIESKHESNAHINEVRTQHLPDNDNPRPAKKSNTTQHQELPLHQIRLKKKKKKSHRPPPDEHNGPTSNIYKRTHLAHDSHDKLDMAKLRLATAQMQRKVTVLKERLESWDPVEEAKLQLEQQQHSAIDRKMELDAQNQLKDRNAREQAHHEYNLLYASHGVNSSQHRRTANLRSKPRSGPSSWKLRGAARPAHEVYDFDVRYVDTHVLAKEEANAKARRVKNVLKECLGRFAIETESTNDDGIHNNNNDNQNGNNLAKSSSFAPPQPYCRQYLSLLTQLGSLHLHRKNYSSARSSFLEAITLEGHHWSSSITNARNQLMTMYMSTNRPSSARQLYMSLPSDNSAWIKYSAALVEYVSWNVLHEKGSTSQSAERLLAEAIRGNVYVVYLLGWPNMFERSMEYTHEVVESGLLDRKSGSLLEAIEYGCNCYSGSRESGDDTNGDDRGMGLWLSTEGSLAWVRSVVLRVLNENTANEDGSGGNKDDGLLTKADLLCWESQLINEEDAFESERNAKEKKLKEKRDQRDQSGNCSDEDLEEDEDGDDDEEKLDVVMYAGMFRTAMDWLHDAGEFLKEPTYEYITNVVAEEECAMENNDKVVEKEDRDNAIDDSYDTSDDSTREEIEDDDDDDEASSSTNESSENSDT